MPKIKLFYVEDEPSLSKIVKESLESRDFEVKLLNTGMNAVEEFINYEPDVCILDVMLPQKDGFTIGNEIRALKNQIPIIFLTAKNQTEDVIKGFASGGNDYIRKPFSIEELIIRIHNLLSITNTTQDKIAKSISSEEIRIGSYLFEPLKLELQFKSETRRLSFRESELLHLLSGSLNQTVLRKDILNQIWGNDSFFNSRNLDVYINKLRDYLSLDNQVQLITLKGLGYRLIG
ncbi:MAG: response regulator transcription factor [Saprospiraceae bacterium]